MDFGRLLGLAATGASGALAGRLAGDERQQALARQRALDLLNQIQVQHGIDMANQELDLRRQGLQQEQTRWDAVHTVSSPELDAYRAMGYTLPASAQPGMNREQFNSLFSLVKPIHDQAIIAPLITRAMGGDTTAADAVPGWLLDEFKQRLGLARGEQGVARTEAGRTAAAEALQHVQFQPRVVQPPTITAAAPVKTDTPSVPTRFLPTPEGNPWVGMAADRANALRDLLTSVQGSPDDSPSAPVPPMVLPADTIDRAFISKLQSYLPPEAWGYISDALEPAAKETEYLRALGEKKNAAEDKDPLVPAMRWVVDAKTGQSHLQPILDEAGNPMVVRQSVAKTMLSSSSTLGGSTQRNYGPKAMAETDYITGPKSDLTNQQVQTEAWNTQLQRAKTIMEPKLVQARIAYMGKSGDAALTNARTAVSRLGLERARLGQTAAQQQASQAINWARLSQNNQAIYLRAVGDEIRTLSSRWKIDADGRPVYVGDPATQAADAARLQTLFTNYDNGMKTLQSGSPAVGGPVVTPPVSHAGALGAQVGAGAAVPTPRPGTAYAASPAPATPQISPDPHVAMMQQIIRAGKGTPGQIVNDAVNYALSKGWQDTEIERVLQHIYGPQVRLTKRK